MRNYEIMFQNGSVQTVGSSCKEWCLEQHYIFFHNEIIQSLWLLAVPMFALFVHWALTTCDQEVFDQFADTCKTTPEKMKKIINLIPMITGLMIVMYIMYILFVVVK